MNLIKALFGVSGPRLVDKPGRNFLTPKNFYTNEVFIFAGISLVVAFLVSGVLILTGQETLVAFSNMIFIFFLIFILLIRLNNRAYMRNKEQVEYLIAVNNMDCIDAIQSFIQLLPGISKRADGSILIDREGLDKVMKETFGENHEILSARFIEWNGDIINWLASLEPHEREKLYRHQLFRA